MLLPASVGEAKDKDRNNNNNNIWQYRLTSNADQPM